MTSGAGEALRAADPYNRRPSLCAAFVAGFVPRACAAGARLVANSVIDLRATTDVLQPLSLLLATATRVPGGLDPDVRKNLLDSHCLDTLVSSVNSTPDSPSTPPAGSSATPTTTAGSTRPTGSTPLATITALTSPATPATAPSGS